MINYAACVECEYKYDVIYKPFAWYKKHVVCMWETKKEMCASYIVHIFGEQNHFILFEQVPNLP